MSLSVRDLSPEMLVLEVPDMFAKAMPPTPLTEVARSMVMSACAIPAANPRMLPNRIAANDRGFRMFMEIPLR
jgi:hypothetical protein